MSSSTESDRHAVQTALTALLASALVMGLLVAAYGLVLVVVDLADHDDAWDGFGVFFGLMLGVPGLTVAALAWLALRKASLRRPAAIVLGLLLVAPMLAGTGAPLLLLPMLVGVGLLVVAVLGPVLADQP